MITFDVQTDESGVGVVSPRGRLNMVAAPRLTEVIDQLLGTSHTRVAVDLSGTEFIDSSGLGALIAGLKRTRMAGGDLRLVAPSEQVLSVLELTNLHRVLTPHDSVQAAFHES